MQAKGPDRGNIPDLGKGGKRTSNEISHESHRRSPQVGRALWRRRQKRRRAKCPKSGEDRTLNCNSASHTKETWVGNTETNRSNN